MKVAVIGTGYVGLVMAAGLAETGHDVVGADRDESKIELLGRGEVPIYEPGLEPLVRRNLAERRLRFTTDVAAAVRAGEVVFIAVGTPQDEDGSADLSHVLDVAATIGDNLNAPKVIVTKSTVPVGTAEKVRAVIASRSSTPFHMASNPEFLKEGAAVEDFMRPDRIVCGVDNGESERVLRELYEPFVRSGNPLLFMDIPSAEMTKYAANAMLAVRITMMNQFANLCERVGASIEAVRRGIGSDPRIGKQFLFPGPGYGGSCFPKDVKALITVGREVGSPLEVLEAVDRVNREQQRLPLEKLRGLLGDLRGKRVAVWGLSFKANTDDMREAASLVVIEGALAAGAEVVAHDPKAINEGRRRFGDRVRFEQHRYDALEGADALVVLTEWQEYRVVDYAELKRRMRGRAVVDARNLYEPARMREQGFTYASIGRP
ncbi:MAG TPA: UDP-glucose/GDP-mannose dehydrogenase family protein [Gemmatimonadales bacterium]|nr:UDP-glucose/GDP-mannose dehydrogenase family protein [Gemmatimonadales bacterium]